MARKVLFGVCWILSLVTAFNLILSCIRMEWIDVCLVCIAMVLYFVPQMIEKGLKIRMSLLLKIVVMMFVFCGIVLGEVCRFYSLFTWWDTMLHTLSGFLFAIIGLHIFDFVCKEKNINNKVPFVLVILFAFCFSMTTAVIWEFFEFTMDHIRGTDMQAYSVVHSIHSNKISPDIPFPIHFDNIHEVVIDGQKLNIDGYLDVGLADTIEDMFVNFIGASVFCIIASFKSKFKFAKNFLNVFAFVKR